MILAHSEHLLFVKEFKIFLLLGYYVTLSQTFVYILVTVIVPVYVFQLYFAIRLSF